MSGWIQATTQQNTITEVFNNFGRSEDDMVWHGIVKKGDFLLLLTWFYAQLAQLECIGWSCDKLSGKQKKAIFCHYVHWWRTVRWENFGRQYLRLCITGNLREDVFIASPNRQYLGILFPTIPATTIPEWLPSRILTWAFSSSFSSGLGS